MVRRKKKVNKPQSPLPSYWDKLPNELKEIVFEFASPLTLFMNGRLKLDPDDEKDDDKAHSLWTEALDIDWPGDLGLLPDPADYIELEHKDLVRVKSGFMYKRLCKRFPNATERRSNFAKVDAKTDTHVQSSTIACEKDLPRMDETPLRLLHIPMRHMWFDLLVNKIDKFPYARANDCIVEGHADLLRHLVNTGKVDLRRMLHVRMRTEDGFILNHTIDAASANGCLDIVKMLHETGCHKATTEAMDWAAENGHFDVLKWLHENRSEGCTTDAMDMAAMEGHLDIVKWLHENRTEGCTTDAMDAAAEDGHLDVVLWLHENRTEGCTTEAMDGAAENGHLDVIKWLHENRTEGCSSDAMDNAAEEGHLDVIIWLHENRTEGCTTDAMDAAAASGHLEVFKWLNENREEGCTSNALMNADEEDHDDIVEYILEHEPKGFDEEVEFLYGDSDDDGFYHGDHFDYDSEFESDDEDVDDSWATTSDV